MKLISCHVENFGKLSDAGFTFSEGCNTFLEDNGWGKSTLAAFLKAMFYGLENSGKRSELENERKRYAPWQKGVFGGQIVFESDGKEYLLERTFGSKASEDICVLRGRKTNQQVMQDTDNLGEYFFGVDSESFRKTVFISQNDAATHSNATINAKIGNLTELSDDLRSYDSTAKRIKEKLDSMTPKRSTGSLYKLKKQIEELEVEIRKGEVLEGRIDELERQQEDDNTAKQNLDEELTQLQRTQSYLNRYENLKTQNSYWLQQKQMVLECEKQYGDIKRRFAGKVPSEEEISAAISKEHDSAEVLGIIRASELSDEEEGNLLRLEEKYKDGIPQDSELESVKNKLDEAEELRETAASLRLSQEEERRLTEYDSRFSGGVPDITEVDSIIRRWNGRNERKSALASKQVAATIADNANAANASNGAASAPPLRLILIIIGAVLLAAGAAVAFTYSMTLGIAAAIVGAALIIAGIFIKGKAEPAASHDDTLERLRSEIHDDEAFIREADSETEAFLSANKMTFNEISVLDDLYALRTAVRDYDALNQKRSDSRYAEAEEQYRENIEYARAFLIRYHGGANSDELKLDDDLNALSSEVQLLIQLRSRNARVIENRRKCNAELDELRAFLNASGVEYTKTDLHGQLQELSDLRKELTRKRGAAEEARRVLAELEGQIEDLDAVRAFEADPDVPSIEDVNEQISHINDSLKVLDRNILGRQQQIDGAKDEYNMLAAVAAEADSKKEQLANDRQYYKRLDTAGKMLEQAKNNLTARYYAPVKTAFDRYEKLITGEDAEKKYHMDVDGKVASMEAGLQRDTELLSVGYQDLIGVALRFALADAMYPEEKPFLILDDPFVNFDSQKLARAKQLLDEVAERYQIIYFTCHESRGLNENVRKTGL